jgi:anti-sigma B factor antagonist
VTEGSNLRQDPIAAVENVNGACVIRLAGELDLYNAAPVREALFEACSNGPTRIVVDLSAVDFIDSTALGVLIEARTKLTNRKAFLLAAPGLETKRALQISGLDRHFAVHDTVEDALSSSL